MCHPTVQNEILEWIEYPVDRRGSFFGLKVYNDSMDMISPSESIIIIDLMYKERVPNACYVIADIEGNATFKRFRPNPMRFEPVSKNPSHTPIFPDQKPLIVGRVKRKYLDL
jgi:SOS-response transcriptional repressor LexA